MIDESQRDEEAVKLAEALFHHEASRMFMTPTVCPKFLATEAEGRVLIAFGGGGYYATQAADGTIQNHPVATAVTAVSLAPQTAKALLQALTDLTSQKEEKVGE